MEEEEGVEEEGEFKILYRCQRSLLKIEYFGGRKLDFFTSFVQIL